MKTEKSPVIIPDSVSVLNCSMMRAAVEGRALEMAGEIVHEVRNPGMQVYQLNSWHILVTYLLIDGMAASWDADKCKWVMMSVPADHIEKSKLMEKIH